MSRALTAQETYRWKLYYKPQAILGSVVLLAFAGITLVAPEAPRWIQVVVVLAAMFPGALAVRAIWKPHCPYCQSALHAASSLRDRRSSGLLVCQSCSLGFRRGKQLSEPTKIDHVAT